MLRAFLIAVLLTSAAFGQSKALTVRAGLIEIPLNPTSTNSDVDITWEARQPLDLQYRVYEDGHVFVTYSPAGRQLIIQSDIIDWEKRKRAKVNWIVTVVEGPVPPTPPGPNPPTPPTPPGPDAAPFPSSGFAVMVIRESSDMASLPTSQRNIFTSTRVAEYLRSRCAKLEDGELAARFFDDDYTDNDLRNTPETMRLAYAVAKRDSEGTLPWIVISNGQTGFSGPLPLTIDDTIKLLREYGG